MILLLPTHLISKNINESILVIVRSNAIFVTLLPPNLAVWKTINLPTNQSKKLSNAKYAIIQLQDHDTWSNTIKVFLILTEKNLYNKLNKEKDDPFLIQTTVTPLFITAWIQCPKYLINEIHIYRARFSNSQHRLQMATMDGRAVPKIRTGMNFGTWYRFLIRDLLVRNVVRIVSPDFFGPVCGTENFFEK